MESIETVCLIAKELERAKELYPDFAKCEFHGVSILSEEVGEAAQAINDGDYNAAQKELAQVAAVAIRLIMFLDANSMP